jgi:hypothetical protein
MVSMTWWVEMLMPEVYGFASFDETSFDILRERVLQGPPKN